MCVFIPSLNLITEFFTPTNEFVCNRADDYFSVGYVIRLKYMFYWC